MVRVRIDGVLTELIYDSFSGSRGYQYLTAGNRVSHAFPWRLEGQKGACFRLNAHDYEILQGGG